MAFGAGGAIAVALDSHTTSATINSSTTDDGGTTTVEADGTETLLDVAIAAGAGGIAGVAGAIGVASLSANVTAAIIAAKVNQDDSYQNSNQNVTVKATDNASVTDGIGSLVPPSARRRRGCSTSSASRMWLTPTSATISKVAAGGNIDVEADGDKTFSSNVFSFALSGVVSLNGTVSVIGIGTGLSSQAASQLNKIQGTANNNISLGSGVPGLNTNNDQGDAADQQAGLDYLTGTNQNAQTMTTSSAMDVTGALSTDQTPHDTEADVGKNVTLSAGGDVSVFANETLNPSGCDRASATDFRRIRRLSTLTWPESARRML